MNKTAIGICGSSISINGEEYYCLWPLDHLGCHSARAIVGKIKWSDDKQLQAERQRCDGLAEALTKILFMNPRVPSQFSEITRIADRALIQYSPTSAVEAEKCEHDRGHYWEEVVKGKVAGQDPKYQFESCPFCPRKEKPKEPILIESLHEAIVTAYHGIRAFASYGHGAQLNCNGISEANLQRAHAALEKAMAEYEQRKDGCNANG